MNALTPTTDTAIQRRYGVGTLDQKTQNKTALQESLGWPAEPKRPMLCFPAGMTDALGGALMMEILPGLLTLPCEIIVLGKGAPSYGAVFTQLSKEHRHRVHIMHESGTAQSTMLAAADMALFLADASRLRELFACLSYGVVPIAPTTQALDDYDPVQEAGNAFLYDPSSVWHCFAALVRAVETYKFPFDWRTIQRHCMETAGRA